MPNCSHHEKSALFSLENSRWFWWTRYYECEAVPATAIRVGRFVLPITTVATPSTPQIKIASSTRSLIFAPALPSPFGVLTILSPLPRGSEPKLIHRAQRKLNFSKSLLIGHRQITAASVGDNHSPAIFFVGDYR
jgi:hypothetical protein